MQAIQTIAQAHPVALAQIKKHRYTHLMRRLYLPPVYWRDAFCDKGNELKAQYQTDTIKTWDALLVELCERKFVVKDILQHFLSWLPFAKGRKYAADGVVFKKADDWQRETGINENQIYSTSYRKVLTKIGVLTFNGVGNILHFKLDPEAFTRAIAKALGLSYLHLKTQIWSVFSQVQSVKSQNRPAESGKPLTDSTQQKTPATNNSESVSISNLSSFELLQKTKLLSANECKRYAALSRETIHACIDSMETATIKTSRRAYFRSALKNQVEEQAEKTHKQSTNQFAGITWGDLVEKSEVETEKSTKEYSNPVVAMSMTAIDAWKAAYSQLELQLDKATFLSWFNDIQCAGLDNDIFVVVTPRKNSINMLQRFYRNIRRVLADVLLKPADEVKIRFEIQKGI